MPRSIPGSPRFVGRESLFHQIVALVAQGHALVLVEGEPGIGKTRLVHEVLQAEPLAARRVMIAACPPTTEPFPFTPVVDGLRRLVDQLQVDIGSIGLSEQAGALRPVFPQWAAELPSPLEPSDNPKEIGHRVRRALTELVNRLAIDVLVLEDAHWADAATLEWLVSFLDEPTSIVVTYRPDEISTESPLRTMASRMPPQMTRLRAVLDPLDVAAIQELVGSMVDVDEVSEEFAAFVHDHTDGLPLAVEESVRLLRDRHDIVPKGDHWIRRVVTELGVPPTVRDSVLERLSRAPAVARQVLDAAAVINEPAEESLLADVAGLESSEVVGGITAALSTGILQEVRGGRYAFRHALDAQAVAGAIPGPRRQRLHQRAAEALLDSQPQPVVRLAHHYREAHDLPAWCHYAEVSADLAVQSGDDRTAIATLIDILSSVEHPFERRLSLTRKLAEVWFFGDQVQHDYAGTVVTAVRSLLDSPECSAEQRGEIRLLLGRALWSVDQERSSYAEFEAAIPDLRHRPDLALACMLNLSLPFIPDWPAARHLEWLERATELAESASPRHHTPLSESRATTLLLLGEEAGWQPVTAPSAPLTTRRDRSRAASHALNTARASLLWGRYAATQSLLDDAAQLIRQADYQELDTKAQAVRAHLDWYTGNWDDALGVAATLTGDGAAVSPPLIQGLVAVASGRRSEAITSLSPLVQMMAETKGLFPDLVPASAAMARLHLADRDADRAVDLTRPVVTARADKGVWLWITDIIAVHVDALIAEGCLPEAVDIVDRFEAGLSGVDAPAPKAAALDCRARIAAATTDLPEAARLFARAADSWAALPRPYSELLAREQHGLTLVAIGDRDAGVAVLSDVHDRLRRLGAAWDAGRVAQVLRQHDIGVDRSWKGGRRGYGDDLSPRERDVLDLVAQGMTNRQVGEALFLSPKTVGMHLGAAMRKLGVNSRTAAVMAAAEAGLIDLPGR